jgi:hypothetical protein
MARLTERRFERAKDVLDRYRDNFLKTHNLSSHLLEADLRPIWNLGYQELKPIFIELSKKDGYELLAARYMEGQSPGAVSEFKPRLAEMYGMAVYDSPERENKTKEFWKRAFGK